MLSVVDIKMKDESNCIITLSRDGQEFVYECHAILPGPRNQSGIWALHLPEKAYIDLIDYDMEDPPGRSHGAIYFPFLRRLYTLVTQVAEDIPIQLPEVLDKR